MACDCFLGLYSVEELLHVYAGAAGESSGFAFLRSVQSAGLAGGTWFCFDDKAVAAQRAETEIRSGGTEHRRHGCIDCRAEVQRCRVANEVHLRSLHECRTLQEGQFSAKAFRILVSAKAYDVSALRRILPAAEQEHLGFRLVLCHEGKQFDPLFLAHCLRFPERAWRKGVILLCLRAEMCRFPEVLRRRVEAWLWDAFAPYIGEQRDVAVDFMNAFFDSVRLGFGEEKGKRVFVETYPVFRTRENAHQPCREETLNAENDIIMLLPYAADDLKQIAVLAVLLVPNPYIPYVGVIGEELFVGRFHHKVDCRIRKLVMQFLHQ